MLSLRVDEHILEPQAAVEQQSEVEDVASFRAGSDALAAVLLADLAVQVEQVRSRPETAPSSQALPAPDDEWV